MRGVQIDRFGEPADVVRVIEREPGAPGPGQVRVRMQLAPINPSDLSSIRGVYTKVPSLPFAPGYEGVGVVESAGSGLLGRFYLGKRVALLSGEGGTWQEFVNVPARQVFPVPADLPLEQTAMFFVNPVTAYLLTRKLLNVPAGEWLLQTAAGSVLGKMVIRLAEKYGFRTINVVRRHEQAEELLEAGADEVISVDRQDLLERVMQITGGAGVRYALDCVSGALGSRVVQSLAPGGRLIVFGTMSGEPLSFSSRDLMTPGTSIEGFWLGNTMGRMSLFGKIQTIRAVARLVREGVLVSEIGNVFPLEEVAQGVVDAERSARGGKTLLRIA